MKPFRVALVGCGAISANHISAILAAGQTLCALCDIRPERAEARRAQFSLDDAHVYSDYTEMLDREKPDAVHIATPHDLHAPMSVEALGRGIHVLCEKPIAISEEGIRAVLRAERSSPATFGVCHQNRYEPTMLRLRELLREKGVRSAAATVLWKRDDDYYRSGDWRGTLLHEGGGVMINQALHTLDLLSWCCGMPTHVTAHIANDYHRGVIEVEDTASATFECPGGGRFHFFATTAATGDLPIQIQALTSDGASVLSQNRVLLCNGEPLAAGSSDEAVGKWVWGTGHRTLIADFYRCIREGIPFGIDAKEGAKVVRMILAMYRSDGQRVSILPPESEQID